MSDALVFRSIAHSNLPPGEKSAIRRWLEKTTGISEVSHRVRGHVVESAHAFRSGAEGLMTGGLLGFAHASLKNGLDLPGPKGYAIPIDGVVAAAGLVGAAYAGGHADAAPFAADLRNAGTAAIGVLSFRKTFDFIAAKRKAKGLAIGGKFAGEGDQHDQDYSGGHMGAEDEDPLIKAARALARPAGH